MTQVFEDTERDENDENVIPKKAKVTDSMDGEDILNMNTNRELSLPHGGESARQPDLISFTPLVEKKMDVKVI